MYNKQCKSKNFREYNSWYDFLIHINKYNTDKQSLVKKIGDVDEKISEVSALVTTNLLIQKLGNLRTKYQMLMIQSRK